MKKLVSLALAVLMVCSLSIGVGAENGLETGDHADNEVFLTVTEISAGTVYSVDITWNTDLEFEYTKGTQGDWDTVNHYYGAHTGAHWITHTQEITVTNHSNAAIQYDAAYSKISDDIQNGVEFTFKETEENQVKDALADVRIDMPVISGPAKSSTFTVTADGTPTVTRSRTKIGNVTVTIEAVS